MNKRPIPATGELLPVIGCGTYRGFDMKPGSSGYAHLPGVVDALLGAGGTVLDSSPMYGRAETTTGELLASAALHGQAFLATKVWTQGRDAGILQMQESMRKLGTSCIDLMQVHNLVDWRIHLKTLRGWKERGLVRYIGITHYSASAYADVEKVLQSEPLDFLQINYSIVEREAEQRLLPLAASRGVAVLINMPFGGGGLMRRLGGKPLPPWSGDIGCTSWPQILLKFVLSHQAVTCAIPGSSSPEHMTDNAAAGHGQVPEASFWNGKVDTLLD